MATKNIVPRATGEGKLGTSSKKWLEINTVTGSFELLKASGLQDGSGNDLIVAGDNITVNKSSSGQFEISGTTAGISDVVSDTSPQLGGDLDLNGSDITGTGNINITGNLTVDGSVTTLSTTNLVVEDPVVLLASGSTSSNTEGGIAILSGSSVSNESLVFGRVANDTWGVGRKDVTGGTATDLSDMTLVDFKAATINASIITASNGFSGSLTRLTDGTSYIIEGDNITVSSASNGAITLSSTNTVYTAGLGLGLTGSSDTEFTARSSVAVTVAGGKFVIDGTSQQTMNLAKGVTYYFDQSDNTNSTHPLRFSTTSDGTHDGGTEFTTGVIYGAAAGGAGAFTQITLEQDAPDVLYYYCANHSGMGGKANSGAGSAAADDITIGDAAVSIGTTSGNTTINSANGQTTIISGSNIALTSENNVSVTGDLIPAESGSFDLGSATKEWKDLFLGENSVIRFGDNSNVLLMHDDNEGLILSMSSDQFQTDPKFTIQGDVVNGPQIKLYNKDNTVPRSSNIIFDSDNSSNSRTTYSEIKTIISNDDPAAGRGSMVFRVPSNGGAADCLILTGSHSKNNTSVNIVEHDGSDSGLQLAGTLVTAIADELNLLDGSLDQASPTTTIVDADRFIINDAGTMTHVSASVLKSYIGGGTTYSSQTGDFTAAAGYHYGVDTSSGIVTATLPSVSSNADSSIRFKIKAGSNALILEGDGSDTIDGFSSFIITDLSQSLSVMSDAGTNWEIF